MLSVIIPAYNARDTIRATLRSLEEQVSAEHHEVILVDSSDDGTDEVARRDFPWVHLIHLRQRTDPGTARNLAIEAARGEIIACLDADCRAGPGWVLQMLAAHEAGHQVVGGAVENGNPNNIVAWAGYMSEFREFLPTGSPHDVNHIPTCNISYDRAIFERYGGFPTQFYPQEDLLYHWRLTRQGVAIWFDSNIRVLHTHRRTLSGYLTHQSRIGRITARVLRLTGEQGVFIARSPLLALAMVPVLPLVKWGRTLRVFQRTAPAILGRHPAAIFFMLIGMYAWAVGFLAGAISPPWLPDTGADRACEVGDAST
jgi:glycosyltransferase involved in cell wall biosynthesis